MNKMRMLANLPIYVDKIPIYSPTLKSIAEIGKKEYSTFLSSCIITKDMLIDKDIFHDINDFDILTHMCLESNLYPTFINSLFFFTKLEFSMSEINKELVFMCNDIELNKANYHSFIKNIKYVNRLEVQETKEMDEFDRRCAEAEKKIQEHASKDGQPELEDLISAVANMDGNGLNIINIWDLNIYQFYEQLQRGQLKEQYRLAMKQLLTGLVKQEEVTVESYFKTIK